MFFVILILFLAFGSLLTIITVQNLETSVSLSVFAWHMPMLPLGLVVVFSFLLGALLLYVVSLLSAWYDRRQIKRLRQRIAQLEQAATGSVIAAPLPGGGITAMPMPGMPPDSMPPAQPQ
ncbi:MAG TPA: LapA family protein [Ktedonobacteraceae bacterium]|nr:LapA family protein [Ktedonobacteraceae bacterium]